MQMTGNDFIAALKEETYASQSFTAADQATVNLDDLFTYAQNMAQKAQLFSGELLISGDEPISLRLESSLVNLPLRYTNAISKIVINDPAADVQVYMIVEHPLVTKSGLRIEKVASVAAFIDDPESSQVKIATFFDKYLQVINEQVALAATADEETTND